MRTSNNLGKLLQEAQSHVNIADEAAVSNFALMQNIPVSVARQQLQAVQAQQTGLPTQMKAGFQGGANLNPSGVASFSVKVTRTGTAVNDTLYAPVGSPAAAQSQYRESVTRRNADYTNMTGGITAATAALAASHNFNFGADVLNVSSQTRDYPSLLQSLFTNIFEISNIRMTVNDTTLAAGVFSNNIEVDTLLPTGAEKSNELPVDSSFSPYQDQQGIIDVPVNFSWSPDKVLLLPVPANDGLSITYTFTVSKINRVV